MKTQPTANGEGLPLMGAAYWIARAAEPYHDRVGPGFTLATFPRRGESEDPVAPVPAVTSARSKSRARKAA